MFDIQTSGIILSKQRTTKVLVRSAPLLFAYGKNMFSHDVPQMIAVLVQEIICAMNDF